MIHQLKDHVGAWTATLEPLPFFGKLTRYLVTITSAHGVTERVIGVPSAGWLRSYDQINALYALVRGVRAEQWPAYIKESDDA